MLPMMKRHLEQYEGRFGERQWLPEVGSGPKEGYLSKREKFQGNFNLGKKEKK